MGSPSNTELMHQANRRAHQWLRLHVLDDQTAIAELRAGFTVADHVWVSGVLTSLTEAFLRSLGDKADPETVAAHRVIVDLRDQPARDVDWSALTEAQIVIVDRLSEQITPDVSRRARQYAVRAGISYRAGQ